MEVIKGNGIILREIVEQDWNDIHTYAALPEVSRFQSWGPNTEEETKAFVKQILNEAKVQPRLRYAYAIIEKENSTMIGSCELNIRDIPNRIGEVAYIIHPAYWRKGYATEAAKQMIEFGFGTFNLHRIFATCDTRNIASAKVLGKIGMTLEGRMREDLLIKDGWRDSYLYSVLDHEWKAR
ncbi:GNAT family N-acetyltransferase [Lederbergia wuyishanensis]|uniref:RimJ/RimL family protein N-acetyltransferase n=1 Tax=Lederbergia wuyishanensis TaxID=1347903 RepID=A0ABU0CYS2_9BACI|nr:GNAT family protein [Lederbergia wuyishanensis]MCJ8005930.1 GNAT family N-acetyltransferase [Lederbergia wuyishanensis]MDQ0341295.1 RimJ/RimL family protein N-acetyltransferase [Lederbergia wuyishanensis]